MLRHARDRPEQAEEARLAAARLDGTLGAAIRADLRPKQADLLGAEAVPGEGRVGIGGQRRAERLIDKEPLQHRVEVTHGASF
jgi:hypothetical protein